VPAGATLQVGSGIAGTATTSVTALGASTAVTLSGGSLMLAAGNGVGNGLTGQYYAVPPIAGNTDFNNVAAVNNLFNALTPTLTANTTTGSRTNLDFSNAGFGAAAAFTNQGFTNTLNYQVRLAGKINITTPGVYTFSTTSDDGSVLFIDGTQVVANNAYQGATQRTGTITLTSGMHDIGIGFYQGNGGAGLLVQYALPGGALQTIPNSVLAPVAGLGYGNNLSVTASSTLASTGNLAAMGTLGVTAGTTRHPDRPDGQRRRLQQLGRRHVHRHHPLRRHGHRQRRHF